MEKDAKVVMLPTNEKANIILDRGILEYIPNAQIADTINSIVKGYHLYITSDDEIKVGDWYFNPAGNQIAKCEYKHEAKACLQEPICKKIIATTDSSLMLTKFSPFADEVGEQYEVHLPQPSQSFIEIFVREYNKGNVITNILVEYERFKDRHGDGRQFFMSERIKINFKDNTITIKKSKFEI